jgi:peptidoglycan/LPS O-acetylase OafA/YrhL
LVAYGNSLFGLLKLKSSILLGEISYSIYLLHGIVLYVLFTFLGFVQINHFTIIEYSFGLAAVGAIVIGFSTITFITIEKPCIKLGHKSIGLLNRLKIYFSNGLR